MFVAGLVRRLKPGKTCEDFIAAWYPGEGFGVTVDGPMLGTNIADERGSSGSFPRFHLADMERPSARAYMERAGALTMRYETPLPHRHGRNPARPGVLVAAAAAIAIAAFAAGAAVERPAAYSPTAGTPAASPAAGLALPTAGFSDLVARVRRAVVSVEAVVGGPSPVSNRLFGFGRRAPVAVAEGSAFFISPDGYAVTNNHVIEGARTVRVTMDDGSVHAGEVVGADPATDLALIKVDVPGAVDYVRFSDVEPRVGDWVVAVGSPFGLGRTVTAGIVSTVDRNLGGGRDGYIQIDAPINQGNSGGPTFDLTGKVVGVNAMIFSPNGGSVGVGFGIPAATAKAVIGRMMRGGHGSLLDRLF